MARQDYGSDLTFPVLQPGWKLSDDGFGLHTISATFKYDGSLGFPTNARGEAFPIAQYNYCKLHKYSGSYDALGVITLTSEYVGIDPSVNSGNNTNAQLINNGGLTTEKLETHPYFTAHFAQARIRIAGAPPYTQSPIGPLVSIKNPADFTSAAVTGGAVAITKQQSFIGENGACFENANGGKFLGFVDPTKTYFYGKTSYLAPQQTFSGIIYIKEGTLVNTFIDNLSKSSGTGSWEGNLPFIIPTYLTGPFTVSLGDDTTINQLLLTQVNVESFGSIYKISYEIKYSTEGWHPAVYLEALAPAP
jgi:hypothetical protein